MCNAYFILRTMFSAFFFLVSMLGCWSAVRSTPWQKVEPVPVNNTIFTVSSRRRILSASHSSRNTCGRESTWILLSRAYNDFVGNILQYLTTTEFYGLKDNVETTTYPWVESILHLGGWWGKNNLGKVAEFPQWYVSVVVVALTLPYTCPLGLAHRLPRHALFVPRLATCIVTSDQRRETWRKRKWDGVVVVTWLWNTMDKFPRLFYFLYHIYLFTSAMREKKKD